MKKYIKLIVVLISLFVFNIEINAATAYEGDQLGVKGSTTWFHYKHIDNNPAYCLDMTKDTPASPDGTDVTLLSEYSAVLKDISAIILKSSEIKSSSETDGNLNNLTYYKYYITQIALNQYLSENGYEAKTDFTISPSAQSDVNKLLDFNISEPSIGISTDTNATQTLTNKNPIEYNGIKYIKSNLITIELISNGKFKVIVPNGVKVLNKSGTEPTEFTKNGEFYILVPLSQIDSNEETEITYSIKAETTYKVAKIYGLSNSSFQRLAVNEDETKELTKNYKLTIDFDTYAQVNKKDGKGNYISGAKLQLLNSKKEEMSCTLSDTKSDGTTSSNCSWTTTDKAKYVLNLEAGTYYLKEVSSAKGYALKTELVQVKVTKGTETTVNLVNNKNKITFSKKDATGKSELPGATLEIQDKDGKIVKYCSNLENNECKWVSTSTPKVIEGMAPGKYYFVETIAPEGYVLSKEKVEFEITATTATKTVTMSNKLNKVVISKKDATGKNELPGATLHVLDKDKKSMSCTILKDGKEQKLDKCTWVSGTKSVEIIGLKAGKYYLKETIAPNRYVLSEELVSFEVKEDKEVTNVKMTNKLNKVVISKINAFTKKELPGATLEIQNEKGEIVKYCLEQEKNPECKWVSTEEPFVIEGLPNGTYYLVETIAPKGFVLNKEKVKFTVDGKTAISYVQMENELEVEVPDTLSSRSVLLVAISMFDIALGIGIISYVKKNKYQE